MPDPSPTHDPAALRPVLHPDALYFCDNGAVYCGAHCGVTARCSGRDISGQSVEPLSDYRAEDIVAFRCESCGRHEVSQ